MRKTFLFAAALGATLVQYACYLNPFGGLGSQGGSAGGSSSGSSTPDCSPSGAACSSGETESLCVVDDGTGACSSAYFTVGSQTFPCLSCQDTTSCQQESAQACTGSSSGGDEAGTTSCTPGACSCLNAGPYACGNTCYDTAAGAMQACVFMYGIASCTQCTSGGSGSGSGGGSGGETPACRANTAEESACATACTQSVYISSSTATCLPGGALVGSSVECPAAAPAAPSGDYAWLCTWQATGDSCFCYASGDTNSGGAVTGCTTASYPSGCSQSSGPPSGY
jgi:hypothetical protein